MTKQKKSILLALGFYLFLAVLLPAIWFRDGLMKAGGESSLPLYAPERTLRLSRFIWQEISTGFNSLAFIPGLPFALAAVFFIGKLGLSPAFFQATLFGFLLFSSACSMFYLSFLLTKNLKNRVLISFLSGLFYLLNPFVITNVWCRFLYPFFFFLPLLPLTLALFVHGLSERSVKFVFFISVVSFIFSYVFSSLPLVVTLWLSIGCYLLFYLIKNRKQRLSLIFAMNFFLVALIFWVLTNFWWILPLFKGRSFFASLTVVSNLASLRGVSKFHTLKFVSRMQKSWFLFDAEMWGPSYKTLFFEIISWIVPLIVSLTFVKKRKNCTVCFFGCLAILTLFLVKGTSPPFGEVFAWLFTKSFFFGVFRNPFEKAGLLLAVSYSLLFGVGLGSFYNWAQGYSLKIKIGVGFLIFLICFLTMGIYLWPVWTGQLFGTTGTKVTVKVPEYYQKANRWLNNHGEDFRTLSLPTHFGEGVIYDWQSGSYQGVEPSEYIFDLPVVARKTTRFAEGFRVFSKNLYSHQIWKMMGLFGAKYVLVNKDIAYQKLGYESPEDIKKILNFITKPSLLDTNNERLIKVCNAISHWGHFSEGRFSLPICKIPREKQDWSKETFLRVKIKSDKPVLFELDLLDKNYIRPRWTGQFDKEYILDANQWQSFILPLRVPTEGPGEFDYENIQMLSIIIHTNSDIAQTSGLEGVPIFSSAEIEVGDIYIDEGNPQKTENIHFEKSFGQLDFYKIEDEYFVPRIYATNQFFITGDVCSMFEDMEKEVFVPGKAIYFLESQENINHFADLSLSKNEVFYQPNISFRKMNPTKYEVKVEKARQPFFLVFNENYHLSWELSSNDRKWRHFLVNGYANGYYVDGTGDLDFTLEFLPQRFLELGSLVSGFSVVFLGGCWFVKRLRSGD